MTVISGEEYVTLDRYRQEVRPLTRPWNGTIVSLIIDLVNPLELDRVYEEEVSRIVQIPSAEPNVERASVEAIPEAGTAALGITAKPKEEVRRLVVKDIAPQLLSRETGLIVRAELATLLADGSIVEVDLEGVEDITPSVADECFGKLAARLGEVRFAQRVLLRGGAPILHRLIDFVVGTRIGTQGKGTDGSSKRGE